MDEMFTFEDETDCGIVKCSLLNDGCSDSLSSEKVKMDANEVSAAINVEAGY